jgi:hypothetical protein
MYQQVRRELNRIHCVHKSLALGVRCNGREVPGTRLLPPERTKRPVEMYIPDMEICGVLYGDRQILI